MVFLWTVEKRLKFKSNQKFSTPVFRADGTVFFRKKNCESRLCLLFFYKKKLSIYFEKRTAAVTLYFVGKHITVVQRVIKSSNLYHAESQNWRFSFNSKYILLSIQSNQINWERYIKYIAIITHGLYFLIPVFEGTLKLVLKEVT